MFPYDFFKHTSCLIFLPPSPWPPLPSWISLIFSLSLSPYSSLFPSLPLPASCFNEFWVTWKNFLEVEVRGPFKLVITQEEMGVAWQPHLQCVHEESGKSSEIKLLTCRVCPYQQATFWHQGFVTNWLQGVREARDFQSSLKEGWYKCMVCLDKKPKPDAGEKVEKQAIVGTTGLRAKLQSSLQLQKQGGRSRRVQLKELAHEWMAALHKWTEDQLVTVKYSSSTREPS